MGDSSEVGRDASPKMKREVESLDASSFNEPSVDSFDSSGNQIPKPSNLPSAEQPLQQAVKRIKNGVEKSFPGDIYVQSTLSLATEENTWRNIKIENDPSNGHTVMETNETATGNSSLPPSQCDLPKQQIDYCTSSIISSITPKFSLSGRSQNWEVETILAILTNLLNHTIDLYMKLGENPPPEFLTGELVSLANWSSLNSLRKSSQLPIFKEKDTGRGQQCSPTGEFVCETPSIKTEFHENDTLLIECQNEDARVQSQLAGCTETRKVKKKPVRRTCEVVQQEFDCLVCNEKVAGKDIMKHFYELHPKHKQCIFCGKRSATNRKADLVKHMFLHTGEKRHACEFCKAQFAEKGALLKHTEVHLGERRFECEDCGKKFNRNEHLKTHILSAHSNERPFACNICQSAFNRLSTLKQHLTSHTKDKKYECQQCHLKVSSASDLSKHMRVHTGEKPYRCSHCDKRFSWSGSYRKHLRLHEQQEEFQCGTCRLHLPSKQALKVHNCEHD